jgi:hypothetical protein
MAIALNDQLSIPEEVVSRKLGDETVLLNLTTGTYYGLDAVGTRLWELLGENPELGTAHRAMLEEYDVTSETLEADLVRICEEMLARGLLVH